MEKFNEIVSFIINKNLLATLILIISIVLFFYVTINIIVPKGKTAWDLRVQNVAQEEKLANLQRQQAEQNKNKQQAEKPQKVPVKIFKPNTSGLSTESASIDFVSSVISMLEQTNNSILDISYKVDDSTKSNIPSNVSVVQLAMTLNGTYTSFQDFIYSLYDGEFLATIKSVKITPLQENKNLLEINIIIALYVAK